MQFTLTPHAKKRIEQRGIPVPDSGMNMKPAGKKTRRAIRELCAKSGIQFDKIYWTYRMDTGEGRKKCVCKRFVGITTDLKGDFVAYDLKG